MEKCGFSPDKISELVGDIELKILDGDVTDLEYRDLILDIPNKVIITSSKLIEYIALELLKTVSEYGVNETSNIFELENLKELLNASKSGIELIESGTSMDKLIDTDSVSSIRDSSKLFLNEAYGMANSVREHVIRETNSILFDCCFLNRGNLIGIKTISSNKDLLYNLNTYQQYLYNKICNYVYSVIGNLLDPSGNIANTLINSDYFQKGKGFNTTWLVISELLSPSNFTADYIQLLYNDSISNTVTPEIKKHAKTKLEAYNAYVILKHFDNYIYQLFGKKINIRNFGIRNKTNKYKFSSKSNSMITTWRTSENINVENETGLATKLAIETTRVYPLGSDIPKTNQYLTFTDFTHIAGKIKDLLYNPDVYNIIFNDDFINNNSEFWESLNQTTRSNIYGLSLGQIISKAPINVKETFTDLFDIFGNPLFINLYATSIFKNSEFSQDEIDKIYTLNRSVFGRSFPKSLYNLKSPLLDIFGYIVLSFNSIYNVKHIQYYKDENNRIYARTLLDLSVGNIKRVIESSISSGNSIELISDDNVFNLYSLVENKTDNGNLSSITFNIPNTNSSVTVDIKSGKIYSTINNSELKSDQVQEFINDTLRLLLQQYPELYNALVYLSGSNTDRKLLEFASRVFVNKYISYKYVQKDESVILEIYGSYAPKFNKRIDEMGLIHPKDVPFLLNIALAKASVYGITTASLVKNGEGNYQSLQSLSRLLGSYRTQWETKESSPDSPTSELSLLKTSGLLKGLFSIEEYHDDFGQNKSETKMNVEEMVFQGFINDFIGSKIDLDGLVGNGNSLFLPSVNADKSTIGRLLIDLNVKINDISISEMNSDQIKSWIADELGECYRKIYENIIQDLHLLDNAIEIHCPNSLFSKLANDFGRNFVNFNSSYEFRKNHLINLISEINKIPVELRTSDNVSNLNQYNNELSVLDDNPIEFIRNIIRLELSANNYNLELIDNIHFINRKGKLLSNPTILAQVARFNRNYILNNFTKETYPDFFNGVIPNYELFWNDKNNLLINSIVKSGLEIDLTNENQPEFQYLLSHYSNFVSDSGKLIIAKYVVDNKVFSIVSERDIINLPSGGTFLLHPALEQYNLLDYMFSQQWQLLTVGSFIGHDSKTSSSNVLEQEAGQFNGQHKRNVSHTAQVHLFSVNLLEGIPENYNIAVIEDITDEQGTILGTLHRIKPFDGAVFVHPATVILENNSLGEQSVGITKKPYIHFKHARTGSGGMIKCAGFGMTNDWIRNSPFLYRLAKKMMGNYWGVQGIDILHNYNNDIINYGDMFFNKNGIPYKIEIKANEDGSYNRNIYQVSQSGDVIEDPITDLDHVFINNNFDLWNLFGGAYSMSIDENTKKLLYSEESIRQLVLAMNNIGYINSNVESGVILPLKYADINYVVTIGAIKQGAANVNSNKRFFDDVPLTTQTISMLHSGILLDKEHTADESELSLMTLVISACSAKGYTFEEATNLYNSLKQSTRMNTSNEYKALENLFRVNPESQETFHNIVTKILLNNLANKLSNSNNIVELIASDLRQKANKGEQINYSEVMLPLSDNAIYNKIVSTLTVYFTKSGIRQTIPGNLAVISPAFESLKLYNNKRYGEYSNPEQELLEALKHIPPVFDSSFYYNSEENTFGGKQIIFVEFNSLISDIDNLPVALKRQDDNTVLIDPQLLLEQFNEKIWKRSTNYEPISYDFKSLSEFRDFCLLNEIMHDFISRRENESLKQYESRVNNETLKRILSRDGSLIELGRTYDIIYSNNNFESKLINTPNDYYIIKQQIKDGLINSIKENITVGRNLSSYNVRFSDSNGNSFNIWDLDSSKALFDVNNLDNTADYILEYTKYNKPIPGGITNPDILKKHLLLLLRRDLLNDLRVLSTSYKNYTDLYNWFINSKSDNDQDKINSREWFNKYAAIVNILLLRTDGNKIDLNDGQGPVEVNDTNFDLVRFYIEPIINNLDKVSINGKYKNIDHSSIDILPYEVIMPKVFATSFGLRKFDSVTDIVNDKDFFIKRYFETLSSNLRTDLYDIELKVSNGQHYYLLSPDMLNSGLEQIPTSQLLILNIDDRKYRLDADGNIMYELSKDSKIYRDVESGYECIVTNNFTFYLDNLHYDSINLSRNLDNFKYSKLPDIIELIKNSNNDKAKWYLKYVGTDASSILNENEILYSVNINNYNELPSDHPILRMAKYKHTSFLKHLEIIAARIPALSMLSFMAMKVVGFENNDINNAYVSDMQLLLLGSDLDIDTVSLATFDIDRNGILQTWSPYSNLESLELLNESLKLPYPSGETIYISETDNAELVFNKLLKYFSILNITPSHTIGNIDEVVYNPFEVDISIYNRTTYELELLRLLLNDTFVRPNNQVLDDFTVLMNKNGYNLTSLLCSDLFSKLESVLNKHNLYLNNKSRYNLTKILNNNLMTNMLTVGKDPVNQTLGQVSVDSTTGPIKEQTKGSYVDEDIKTRTPGNVVNKFESITDNQVGKDGIGINAVGLKGFFGLSEYYNYILNNGTKELQNSLLLGSNGNGLTIGNKTYKLLANVKAMNPNTVLDYNTLIALAETNSDEDAAIVLSALLSLSTDNAKELELSKLNANAKTLGLYVFGTAIGIPISELAPIIMSDVGLLLTKTAQSNIFTDKKGFSTIGKSLFEYFDEKPNLQRLNEYYDSSKLKIEPPYLAFYKAFLSNFGKLDETDTLESVLISWGRSNISLNNKLDMLNEIRNTGYPRVSGEAKLIWNKFIDAVKDYTIALHTIGQNSSTWYAIKTLSKGSLEMRLLGSILSLNQGLKSNSVDFIKLLDNILKCIYELIDDHKLRDDRDVSNGGHMIDIVRFVFDKDYQDLCVKTYDKVKSAINILDVIRTLPHISGYIDTLVLAVKSIQSSYKFRSVQSLLPFVTKTIGLKKIDIAIKGIENYISEELRKEWMRLNNIRITIPKGNFIFTSTGEKIKLKLDKEIQLGTDWSDSSFRLWMESQVIPNLKRGKILPGVSLSSIKTNKFILDLGTTEYDKTASRNTTVVYSLPINMMPNSDQEQVIFDGYKNEFNKLRQYAYKYQVLLINDNHVNIILKSIPITDLFIYYSMIAFNWKLGEKSLRSILLDMYNSEKIRSFQDFIAIKDKSLEILTPDNIIEDNIIPYVAPFESPYVSYASYIWYKNKDTGKKQLMEKLRKSYNSDIDDDSGFEEILDAIGDNFIQNSNINGYEFKSAIDNIRYFPKGLIETSENIVVLKISGNNIKITYNIDNMEIKSAIIGNTEVKSLKGKKIPVIKINKTMVIDVQSIENDYKKDNESNCKL